MGLIEQAKKDIAQITSNPDEFGVEMTFTAPAPSNQILTVTGLHAKIGLGVDTDGDMVNSKQAHISVSEQFFTDAGYPVRNDKGEVDLIGHRVSVKDSTTFTKEYIVGTNFPDETIGLISCNLKDYE